MSAQRTRLEVEDDKERLLRALRVELEHRKNPRAVECMTEFEDRLQDALPLVEECEEAALVVATRLGDAPMTQLILGTFQGTVECILHALKNVMDGIGGDFETRVDEEYFHIRLRHPAARQGELSAQAMNEPTHTRPRRFEPSLKEEFTRVATSSVKLR